MDPIERYIIDHTEPEEELLQELDRETHLRTVAPRMISGHIQGKLLKMLVRMLRPRRILEIGTFTGYSALSMAAGLAEGEWEESEREDEKRERGKAEGEKDEGERGGKVERASIDTFEVDDEQQEFIQSYFDRSPYGDRIRLHIGSALELAPRLGVQFDMVFIDGDKREYPDYYRMLMGDRDGRPLVHPGTVLIADNILWYGKVARPVAHNDHHTQGLVEFNRMVSADPRVENVIVPLRDGLNLIRVK